MRRIGLIATLIACALLAGPREAQAVEPYLISLGVLGGLGGTLDFDESEPGLGQTALQVQAALLTEPRTLVVLRVGRLEFDDEDRLGELAGPTLEYATIAGEYRSHRQWYDAGIFLGVGGYRLEGTTGAGARDETAIGLTIGTTGDFEITRFLSFVAELSAHWADLEQSQLFAAGMAGVAVKF